MRKERGAITILTLVTIIFIISFLVSTFVIIANRRQAQAEIKRETQEIYESDIGNEEQIYKSYFANESEIIPIYTVEQLFKVGTDELIVSENKIYKCTADANYKLASNIGFSVEEYLTEYPTLFEEKTYTIIETTETTITNQVENYATANSDSNPYSTYIVPATGTYKLEVWGAQGGTYNSSYATGGIGGYSVGTINLEQGEELYVYVGGVGTYGSSSTVTTVDGGGYNGGGNAAYRGGAGGGATDVRIEGNTLFDRVIVAGGGGGAYAYSTSYKANGGNGGGISGDSGSYYNSAGSTYIGGGASSTAGGAGGTGSSADYYGKEGTFGIGADTGAAYNLFMAYNSNGAGRRRLVWRR